MEFLRGGTTFEYKLSALRLHHTPTRYFNTAVTVPSNEAYSTQQDNEEALFECVIHDLSAIGIEKYGNHRNRRYYSRIWGFPGAVREGEGSCRFQLAPMPAFLALIDHAASGKQSCLYVLTRGDLLSAPSDELWKLKPSKEWNCRDFTFEGPSPVPAARVSTCVTAPMSPNRFEKLSVVCWFFDKSFFYQISASNSPGRAPS